MAILSLVNIPLLYNIFTVNIIYLTMLQLVVVYSSCFRKPAGFISLTLLLFVFQILESNSPHFIAYMLYWCRTG